MHRCLRRAAARRIRRIAIHPVLGDIDVKAAQIDRTKLIERVIDLVEFVGLIRSAAISDHVFQAMQNPAIDQSEDSERFPVAYPETLGSLLENPTEFPSRMRSVFRIRR